MREADGFLLFYDWIKLSMKERVSLIKCYWDRHKTTEKLEVDVSPEELKAMKDAGFEITAVTPKEDGSINVKFNETKTVRNSPKFEVLSIADLRWNPEAMSLDGANLVAERIITNMDTLRRRAQDGFYKNVDKIKPGNIAFTRYEQETKKYGSSDEEEQEDALKPVLMYEIYMKTDINGDGMAEDVVVHWCNKQILKIQENTMGRHPYFPATPIREPRKIYPLKGFAELLGELQDIKTALLRQIIANVAINNDKQAFVNVDVMVDVNEFVQGKKAVRVNGDPRLAVYYMPTEPIPPQVFTLFEFLEATKETQTGVTRYNQGQDASSLNKTATGITQIMGAANQRLEMIVRLIAEGGVKPLLRHLIKMNQMYMEEPMVIRIANKPLQFSPDDLQGNIDVIVNSGVGTGVKQTQIQNLQLLISLYQLTIQAGSSDPGHLSYAFRKLVEELGFKNVDDFSFAPEQIRQNIQAQQAAAQKEQEMMMQMKQQMMGGAGGGVGASGPAGEAPAGAIMPSGEGQIDPRILAAMAGEPQE